MRSDMKSHPCPKLVSSPSAWRPRRPLEGSPASLSAGSENAFVNGATHYDEFCKRRLITKIHSCILKIHEWMNEGSLSRIISVYQCWNSGNVSRETRTKWQKSEAIRQINRKPLPPPKKHEYYTEGSCFFLSLYDSMRDKPAEISALISCSEGSEAHCCLLAGGGSLSRMENWLHILIHQ